MSTEEPKPDPPDTPEPAESASDATAPRGNPDTDRESVEKGEDQLDKISGN